jgi:acetyl-CoA C-acetyltransferase
MERKVVIAGFARSPFHFANKGELATVRADEMTAQVVRGLLEKTGVDANEIEDLILGCAFPEGEQGLNLARIVGFLADLPLSVAGQTINRFCGSSMQAIHSAAGAIQLDAGEAFICAGVESMSRVPMGLSSQLPAKNGFGTPKSPRMEQRYPDIQFSQFLGAEMMAKKFDLSKDSLDEYAFLSHQRAIAATRSGAFEAEVLPIEIALPDGRKELHRIDEGIRFDASLEAIRGVKLLAEGGRITAATSSQIADGASGVMVVNDKGLKALGVQPLARIHHMTVIGHDPVIMLEAPIPATAQALKKAGMKLQDIDLFEVNEAFASVPVGWLKQLDADPDKLNVNGGAIALGHPLGASGTKLMTTLVHALKKRGKRYGLQTMCEGGGLSNVTIIERL